METSSSPPAVYNLEYILRILTGSTSFIFRIKRNQLIAYMHYIIRQIDEDERLPVGAKQEFRNHLFEKIDHLLQFKDGRAYLPATWRNQLAEELREFATILS